MYENTLIEKSEKEAWLQAIFDSSNVGIFIFSIKTMKMIYCNLMFEKLLISKFKTLKTDDVTSFWEPEDWQQIRQGIHNIETLGETTVRLEVKIINSDHLVSWIDLSISPVVMKNPINHFMIGVSTDITSRKIAEQKQAESEKIYNLLVENSEDVIGLVDCEGNNLFFNKKGLEYHEITAEDLKDRPTSSFYDEETTTKIVNTIKKAVASKQTTNEIIELSLHGQDYNVFFSAIPIIEADQSVTRVQTIGRNITKEMNIMKQLGEVNEMLHSIISMVPATLYSAVLNLDNMEIAYDYLSDKIENITGYPVSFFKASPLAFTALIHPDDLEDKFGNITTIVTTVSRHEFMYRIINNEQKVIWVNDVFEVKQIDRVRYRLAGYLSVI
jgi:PAS domain S-box-containing protein